MKSIIKYLKIIHYAWTVKDVPETQKRKFKGKRYLEPKK